MVNTIVTKFAIGTEQGINTLLFIGAATAREKCKGKVPEDKLEEYIERHFNSDVLRVELNSMSNQYVIVYCDGEPAGYARITSKGKRPEIFEGKTVARIADFFVLDRFANLEVKKSLFEKCLSLCSMQQIIWISEYRGHPDLHFFASYGFSKNAEIAGPQELGLAPVYLVKDKKIINNKAF